MEEKYYQIIEKGKETKHGLILKLDSSGLNVVAGENLDENKNELIPLLKLVYDDSKITKIIEDYQFKEISSGDAHALIYDWLYFLDRVAEGGYNPKTFWRCM